MKDHSSRQLSRRAVLGGLAATVASTPMFASALSSSVRAPELHPDLLTSFVPGGVYINANENPLGPSAQACKSVIEMMPEAGRYDRGVEHKVAALFGKQNGVAASNVNVYAGSFVPLHYAGMAFTSPDRGVVAPVPTFDAMFYGADRKAIAPIKQVPLTADYKIDVKAMVAADSNPGIIYICNPNNPTGTTVSHDDIAWLLKNKPAGSMIIVDEAYIHYSNATTALPFVRDGEDIIVSRTFSKIYGMAGLRCGVVVARPDILAKIQSYGGGNPMATPALTAAFVSLQDSALIADRRKSNNDTRDETLAWLKAKGYECVPSEANFFMVKVHRPGAEVTKELATRKIFIGGPRPRMEDWVRVSIGKPDEMIKFRDAFHDIMQKGPKQQPVAG
jgi:histidinol-phosphate aminotransferase